jgi:hypothetical protein
MLPRAWRIFACLSRPAAWPWVAHWSDISKRRFRKDPFGDFDPHLGRIRLFRAGVLPIAEPQ